MSAPGRKLLCVAAGALLAALLLGAVLVAAWVAWDEPLRHAVLTLDDAPVELANLPGGSVALAFVMVFVGVLVSALVVIVVVPLTVLLPLLLVGLVCAVALLVLVGGLGLLLSPLLLLAWGVWRLSRSRRSVATIAP